ncbi:MAG: hypothetical protein JSS07_08310 [Proteobacteria bacterium]|nr:hypothetical protein [Pseudomonadota bacterium]
MLFNNPKCTALTPDYVNHASYHDLHQFKWLDHENRIGELPVKWNHLVGYNKFPPEAYDVALVHWTKAAPSISGIKGVGEYEAQWHKFKEEIMDAIEAPSM